MIRGVCKHLSYTILIYPVFSLQGTHFVNIMLLQAMGIPDHMIRLPERD